MTNPDPYSVMHKKRTGNILTKYIQMKICIILDDLLSSGTGQYSYKSFLYSIVHGDLHS